MVQVLEPFEEGDGHTTGVDVQVGNDENVAFDEDFVSCRRGGAVGSLGNDLEYIVCELVIFEVDDRPKIEHDLRTA